MQDSKGTTNGLCLASHSPRRRLLLESLGVDFFVRAASAEVEEEVLGAGRGEQAEEVALGRARAKGLAVQSELDSDQSILSADTVVHLGTEILDKPQDKGQAQEFLFRLSGKRHGVVTALWLWANGREYQAWVRTLVKFAELDSDIVAAYVETGEPYDKAGGYGIQGIGGTLVEGIEGCYFNVVGLPLRETSLLLTKAGIPWALSS